jgi:outer membrane protein assembly factor BamA
MRRALAGALLGLVLAAPLAAQEPWRASYYPFPLKGPNDQVSLVLHYQYGQAADYADRVPFAKSFSVEWGLNASGSRFLVARFKAPRLADGWRLYSEAGATRENRFGYFGLGNDTEAADDATLEENPWYDRMRRSRIYGRVDLTRRIAGPLHATAGVSLTHASYGSLPGSSHFNNDFYLRPPCLPPGPCELVYNGPDETDFAGRVGLVLDTRDNEFVPTGGVLFEAGLEMGSGGEGYAGYYGQLSAFASPYEGAVAAVRILGRSIDADAPLDARFTLYGWERSIPLLGGPESHRSFIYGRYAGRQALAMNVEYRQDVLNFGDFGAITAIGFVDAGMVQENPEFESNKLHVGGGGGLAIRVLRSTVLQFNLAGGPDGFQFSMGTGWAF